MADPEAIDVLKARIFETRQESNATDIDRIANAFTGVGALAPPYDPDVLSHLLEHSNALRQNIDSYVTNIDSFGHTFVPVVDLASPDADAQLRAYVLLRREQASPDVVADPTRQVAEPTDAELAEYKAELEEQLRVERDRVEQFFEFASIETSFVSLRRKTRQDIEVHGNAYWEVLRNEAGEISGFEYIPAFSVRHMPRDVAPTSTTTRVKTSKFGFDSIPIRKHFRRYVQIVEMQTVFFKEFGDPRCLSSRSGVYYDSIDEMRKQASDTPATELIHFCVHTPHSSYGVPRWIGALISILGSRSAEEVNLTYFDSKAIPPMAILVSDGRMSEETVKRLETFVETRIKGKKNFHSIMVLEAESGGGATIGANATGRARIELKPLTDAQQQDALFQTYDERNIDKVGQAFRLPRMLRGDIRDFNRGTAEAALEFAETQVFGPERDDFDFFINRRILPELGVRFWRFKSNAPKTRNAETLAQMVALLVERSVLTPNEARGIAEQVFGVDLKKVTATWADQPMPMTLAGIAAQEPKRDVVGLAQDIIGLRTAIAHAEDAEAARGFAEAQASHADDPIEETDESE